VIFFKMYALKNIVNEIMIIFFVKDGLCDHY
jgi:hypothetical protein